MTRSYGHGSVYQQSSDGRWIAAYSDPLTGKRVRRSAKSAAEARKILREMSLRADAGEPVADSTTRLEAFAREWITTRAPRNLQPSTINEYESRLRKHIVPALGHLRLGDVRVSHVEGMLARMSAEGKSPATIRAVRITLASMLTDAVNDRLIGHNPAKTARLPKVVAEAIEDRTRATPPDIDAARRLLAATEGTELGRLLLFLAGTGARIGEALAAVWSDVDLEAGSWTVARTVTRSDGGRLRVGDRPKTRRTRTVTLPAAVLEVLREQRRAVLERKVAASWWVDPDAGVVFPTSIGTVHDPRNLRRDLAPIAAEVGFVGSFHQLRHLYSSLAIAHGVSIERVSKELGHANSRTTTDLYGWLLPSEPGKSVGDDVLRGLGS